MFSVGFLVFAVCDVGLLWGLGLRVNSLRLVDVDCCRGGLRLGYCEGSRSASGKSLRT